MGRGAIIRSMPTQRRRKESGKPTIRQVADESGVSTATVSRVLQANPRVRPETRARVLRAIETLNYTPNLIARALVTRSSKTIGLLVPSTGNSFWGAVAAGVESRATEAGFSVLLTNFHDDPARELFMARLLLEKGADALVIAGGTGVPGDWFPRRRPDVPIAFINWERGLPSGEFDAPTLALLRSSHEEWPMQLSSALSHPPFCDVTIDDALGAEKAVSHLIQLGHREVAFAGGRAWRSSLLRVLGYRRALLRAGLGLDTAMVFSGEETAEAGKAAGLELLSPPRRPTAVFCYNDLVAIGVLRAAHALGLRVPQDVSIVGYDDIDVSSFLEPPLTTVRPPKYEMGWMAIDVVLRMLRGEGIEREYRLDGDLVVRASTAPPSST